jgi:hypothetical protein
MVEDIMQQVKERPGMMPVVRHPVEKALCQTGSESDINCKVGLHYI